MTKRNTTTVSSKFQLSIPKGVREESHIEAGQKYVVVPRGDNLLFVKVPSRERLFGLYEGADNSDVRDRNDRY